MIKDKLCINWLLAIFLLELFSSISYAGKLAANTSEKEEKTKESDSSYEWSVRSGLIMLGAIGGGLEFQHNANKILGIYVNHSEFRSSQQISSDYFDGKVTTTGMVTQVGVKYSLSESFYLSSMMSYRLFEVEYNSGMNQNLGFGLRPGGKFAVYGHGPAVGIAIGNRWFWESGFFTRIEWIGLHQPIANHLVFDFEDTEFVRDESNKIEKWAIRAFRDNEYGSALGISLGYSFQ